MSKEQTLANLAEFVVAEAKTAGATDCDVSLYVADSVDTGVRMREVEELGTAVQKQGLSFRAYVGQNSASTSSTDFRRKSVQQMIRDTIEMARASEPDPFAGLPDANHLAKSDHLADLALFDASVATLSPGRKIEMALAAEEAALSFDKRITNSEGAGFSDSSGTYAYANSRGFAGAYKSTRCILQTSVVAGENGGMQSGAWWHQTTCFAELESPESIGREAARRAIRSLGARKVASQQCAVVFDPQMAASLLGKFASAADGAAIYRNSSFLVGKIGQKVASKSLTIVDDGLMPGKLGSRPWGREGLSLNKRTIVRAGRLEQYFLDAYSARKLKELPNGGGITNLYIEPGSTSAEEIIASVQNGLFLTSTSGFGFNAVTGDYSQGAAGIWIENGQLAYPVDEITIAGNLLEMLNCLEVVGNDLAFRGSISSPTLLISRMTVGGK